jgi:hypothetical protein
MSPTDTGGAAPRRGATRAVYQIVDKKNQRSGGALIFWIAESIDPDPRILICHFLPVKNRAPAMGRAGRLCRCPLS